MNIIFFVVLIYKKFNYPKKKKKKVVSGRFTISEKKIHFIIIQLKKSAKSKCTCIEQCKHIYFSYTNVLA